MTPDRGRTHRDGNGTLQPRAALSGFEVVRGPSGPVHFVVTVPDQAALVSALHRLDDLHAHLMEVRRLDD